MRHTLLIALLAAASCRAKLDAVPALDYPCALDGGEAQCPAGWRCGRSLRCHSREVASAYACDTGDDCEQGWRCGLEKTCHDPAAAAAYACAGHLDCEGGWRCALDQTCHDPAVPAALPCATSGDCTGGWRCGLEQLCHDPDAGAAYLCASDSDCEAGWRCGLLGRCIDTRAEALRTDAYEGPVTKTRLSPLLFDAPPPQLAATQRAAVVRVGDTLVHLAPGVERAGVDAGPSGAIAEDGEHTWLAAGARLLEVRWSLDGGVASQRWLTPPGAPVRALRALTDYTFEHYLLADVHPTLVLGVTGRGVWVYDVAADHFSPELELLGADGGPQRIDSAILNPFSGWPPPQAQWIVDGAAEEGHVSALYLPDGGFAGPFAPEPWPARDGGVRVARIEWAANIGSAGGAAVYLFEVSGSDAGLVTGAPNGTLPLCPVCPSGHTLADVTLHGQVLRFWCRELSSRRVFTLYTNPETCAFSRWRFEGSLAFDDRAVGHSTQGPSLHAGVHGQLWVTRSVDVAALTLDRPEALLRSGGRLVASGTRWEADLGFVPDDGAPRGVPVEGHLELAVTSGGVFELSGDAGRRLTTGSAQQVRVAQLADGGTLFIGVQHDQLVTAPAEGDAGAFVFRLAPQPFLPILSFDVLSPGPDLVAGYALTPLGLFHFSASTLQQWRAQELLLPAADYVAVWTDGRAGRIARRDGVVLSLPGRVPVSQPLPVAVRQYAQLCGQTWALADTGLFRLNSDGAWSLEDVTPLLPGAALDTGLDGGRLYAEHNRLWLVTAFGTVVQLEAPPSCH